LDKGSIRGLGWSDDEQLLIVTQDGSVRCYNNLKGDFSQFSLGHGADEHGVDSCRFWSTGFVALLSNGQLIEVPSYDEPRPRLLATPPTNAIHSWSIIPPAHSQSPTVEVLLSVDKTIYVVDAAQYEDRVLQNGPFPQMQVSPNGRYVALTTEDGTLWVISSDFQNKLAEYDPKMDAQPQQAQWCGNDAVVLVWNDEVHVVDVHSGGGNSPSTKYYYDSTIRLVPDIDGVRFLTNQQCELLQKVPEVTESIFRLGSTMPAAVLLDAMDQLEKESPKADDNIQLIRPHLAEAVDACVQAAGYEFDVRWQKALLKAASFGKSVLELFNSDDFVEMCETLRVLNAVRDHEIGLTLSYEQYLRLTPEKLIQRLVSRNEHQIALKISEYFRLPTDGIYIHWACEKVRVSAEDDTATSRVIVSKLNNKKGISFEKIARAAYDEGRAVLATQLLNHEPRADRQVPLLLSMEEDEIALDKGIESGDTDLVTFVLLQLKRKLPLAKFFHLVNSRPMAVALIEQTCKDQDSELLRDLYYQDDRRFDSSNLTLAESLDPSLSTEARLSKIKLASSLIDGAKDAVLNQKALEEYQKLLKLQETLEREITASSQPGQSEPFVGLSVNETFFKLVRLGYGSRAKKMIVDFKIPEKIWWWARLRATVQKRDWGDLEEIAKQKKSPIGWEVSVAILI
jgi:hypothetical protein